MKNKVLFLLAGLVLLAGCNNQPTEKHSGNYTVLSASSTALSADPLVMTKEELQTYFKRRGITPTTKENFKEPHFVMEINAGNDWYEYRWSGLTSHDKVMKSTNDMQSGPESAIYFYGKQGLIKKLTFQNDYPQEGKILKAAETFTQVAENGDYAAALRHEVSYEQDGENSYKNKKHKYTLYFYDDSGNLLWQKDLGWGKLIKMTRDGKYVVVDSVNWNLMDSEAGDSPLFDKMDNINTLNVKQFKIFNYKGEEVFAYKDFAEFKSLVGYGFSGNSRYFYAEIEKMYYEPTPPTQEFFLLYDLESRKTVLQMPREKLLGHDTFPIYQLTYNGDGIVTHDSRLLDLKGNMIVAFNGPWSFEGDRDQYLLLRTPDNEYLYDLDDYITTLKKGEQPKALKKYGFSESLNWTKDFTVLMSNEKYVANTNRSLALATITGEVLWQTNGEVFWANRVNGNITLEKTSDGEKHRLYYRIPQ